MRRLALSLVLGLLFLGIGQAQRVGFIGTLVPITPLPAPAAPDAPTNFSPACGSTGQPTTVTLGFTAAGATSYAIKFNTYSPPTTVVAATNSYTATLLTASTTYYWIATATNVNGSTSSAPCAFTTASGTELIAADGAACADPLDNSPTGRQPRFWSCTWQHNWRLAKADYDANPSSPATFAGQAYKQLKADADAGIALSPLYANGNGNIGQVATLMYQITGSATYAAEALREQQGWWFTFDPDPDPYAFDANTYREWIQWEIIMLDWLWPSLSPANRALWLDLNERTTASIIDVYGLGGYPLGDSDQVVGHYCGVVMMGLNHPNSATAQRLYALAATGGLTATGSNNTTTARNDLKYFVTELAADGEWMESAEYNPGTVYNLLTCYQMIKNHTGADYFPEITAWLPNQAAALKARWTPALEQTAEWGDEESPHHLDKHTWSNMIMVAAGVMPSTAGDEMQDLFTDLVAKYGYTYGNSATVYPQFYRRGYLFYNPYRTESNWRATATNTYTATYPGILWHRSGTSVTDSLLHVLGSTKPDDATQGAFWVDHYTRCLNDVELWKNGDWAFRHPRGYGSATCAHISAGEGANAPLMHGMDSAWEYTKRRATASGTWGAYQAVTTGGSLIKKTYTQPAVAVNEWTRSVLYVSGATDTIITHDRSFVDDIADLGTYPVAGEGQETINLKRARKQWIWHFYNTPTISGETVTSTTPAGLNLKWWILAPTGLTKEKFDEAADFMTVPPLESHPTIAAPGSAPTVSAVAGGSLPDNSGSPLGTFEVSYSYRDDGAPYESNDSPTATQAVSGANKTIRVAVLASADATVDKIRVYVRQLGSGESLRRLYATVSNTNQNVDVTAVSWASRAGWDPSNYNVASYPTVIRYAVELYSNNSWDTFLNVFQAGATLGTVVRTADTTKAECAHVATTGQNDILACFNSTQGSALNDTGYHASHAAALDSAHFHTAKSFTITWTGSAATTDLYLMDLNPALTWTTNVDAAGNVTRSPDTGGFFKFSVSGSGAHSMVVTGT